MTIFRIWQAENVPSFHITAKDFFSREGMKIVFPAIPPVQTWVCFFHDKDFGTKMSIVLATLPDQIGSDPHPDLLLRFSSVIGTCFKDGCPLNAPDVFRKYGQSPCYDSLDPRPRRLRFLFELRSFSRLFFKF